MLQRSNPGDCFVSALDGGDSFKLPISDANVGIKAKSRDKTE